VTLDLAIYHPWTYLRGGAERVVAELIGRSEHRWTLYTHHFAPGSTFPELADGPVVELSPRVEVRRSLRPLAAAAWAMARTQLPVRHQAVLVSSEGLGDLVAFRAQQPVVCYCHTPLKILHDDTTRRELARRNPRQAQALRVLGPAFTVVDRRAWARYRHVFANSVETAERVARAGLRPRSAVEVLHPGADPAPLAVRSQERRRAQFLVAGRIMWQKHLELAIDAFAQATADGLVAELVVAGAVDRKSEPYLDALRQRASGLPVRFEVDVDDARLAELYATSLACLFTAPSEDFGIVPVEAMAAGTVVVAVDGGGVRESVVHGQTGWLLPPDPRRFAEQLRTVAAAGAALEPMRRAARRQAARFSWQAFVGRIDAVMADLVAGRSPVAARSAPPGVGVGRAATR
jgi:glycosyltransferase involved in cell wall biosynthesis